MDTAISSASPENPSLRPLTLTERMPVDVHDGSVPTVGSDSYCDHDPTLLVTALEEIEARRAGLEWLFDANLLCQCLI